MQLHPRSGPRFRERWPLLSIVIAVSACGADSSAQTHAESNAPAASAAVAAADSANAHNRRVEAFRATVPPEQRTDRLDTAAPASREGLVRALVRAVETQDTALIRRLVINRGEFIALYYPSSLYAQKPYLQDPAFVWFQFQENSIKGITRLVTRYGGRELGYRGHDCREEPLMQGANRLWQHCVLDWAQQPNHLRVFGSMIERDGRFKFVSYANDL
jgi:hypothetical protein